MKRIPFTTPHDYTAAPFSGWTRGHWEEAFRRLAAAIIDNSSPGCARQVIPGPRSHHGRLADELEGFTRSFIMAGAWMTTGDGSFALDDPGCRYDVAGFYRRGILSGTNPRNPEYWGDPVDYAQHLVEMASLAWGLVQSRGLIWDTFSPPERAQVAGYLKRCAAVKYHANNWLLFNVVTNAALARLGESHSREQIRDNLAFMDRMYLGEGWYRDGDVNRIDYYNAWAFHYYSLIWVLLDGESDPDRAALIKDRMREFARGFRYFFAADGSVPCFGRSMVYRFGYLAPLALAARLGCLDIPTGQVRTMTGLGGRFYLERPILTDVGFLGLGYLPPCAEMLEHYSCGGSPYWAVKAFNILMIPPGHPFWATPEEPLPIHEGDFSYPIRPAGFLLVGTKRSGHVQLLNQKAYHDKPEYDAKYTKLAYSSHFSYEARRLFGSANCDTAFQFSADGITWRQRYKSEPGVCERDFLSFSYPLHETDEEGRGTTMIAVRHGGLVIAHRIESTRPLWFREGGYPLGWDDGEPEVRTDSTPAAWARQDNRVSFIRGLRGWSSSSAGSFGEDVGGSNVRYARSVVPTLRTPLVSPGVHVFASIIFAALEGESFEQLKGLIQSATVDGETLNVELFDGEILKLAMDGSRAPTKA